MIVSLVNIVFEGMGAFSLTALITTVLVISAGWLERQADHECLSGKVNNKELGSFQ